MCGLKILFSMIGLVFAWKKSYIVFIVTYVRRDDDVFQAYFIGSRFRQDSKSSAKKLNVSLMDVLVIRGLTY